MSENIRFLFKKGMIEVLSYLSRVERANYYKIQKQGFVGSRQTFANLLKELEKRDMVHRKVIESRPPRVEYSLTSKGKEIAQILEVLKNTV